MRLLITGREGQVARSLAALAPAGHELVFAARPAFELGDFASIERTVAQVNPAAIVNAAAWTAVDAAEDDRAAAMRINGEAPGVLALAAKRIGAPLIHLSTDYVFDGSGTRGWVEDDPIAPINHYGETKAAGEVAVRDVGGAHAILRTAWVYSPFGSNFVKTMLRLGADRDRVRVVADQFGCPTSAVCIARAIGSVLTRWRSGPTLDTTGTYHLAGTQETNWAEFAAAIFAESGARGGPAAQVDPITTADFPTRAARPANSRLNCARFARAFGLSAAPWTEALPSVMAKLLVG